MNNNNTNKAGFFVNIVLPSALAVVLFIATLFWFVIPSFESAMLDRKREMIKELTNASTSILDKYYKDETDSLLSREDAQKTAISRIQYLRYGDENKDYFWITDLRPYMIMHPYRPELNGTNLNKFEDSHGKKMFVESVRIARQNGQGYVDYMWQWKDDSTHIVPKLSYVKLFEPWGWIVGTGIYIEDVKKEIALLTHKFVRISFVISLITALLLYYIGRQSLRIEKKRRKAENELHESKEKYKTLAESTTEGMVMLIDGAISFANSIFLKMTGYTNEELQSIYITDILDLPEQTVARILNSPSAINEKPAEMHLKTKTESLCDVLVTMSGALFNGQESVIISFKDLSSDKQIRTELLQSREKFKTLMDKLNIGIFRSTIDLKGRFLEANDTALKILGYKSFDELSRCYILDLFTDVDDKKKFRQTLIEKGFVKNQVIRLKRRNEQNTVVTVSLVVIYGNNNQPEFCDGIIEDVSLAQSTTSFNEDILKDFVSFTQSFLQPVKNCIKNPVFCAYNDVMSAVLLKMEQADTSVIFVKAEGGEVLGYINDNDIRKRLLPSVKVSDVKAFEIMTAPVIGLNGDEPVIAAMHLFKKTQAPVMLIRHFHNDVHGYVTRADLALIEDFLPVSFTKLIEKAPDAEQLCRLRNSIIRSLLPSIENNLNSDIIFKTLSLLTDAITQRIIDIVLSEIGPPPVDFCFISLGSDARKEQTLNTDQDNALIFADTTPDALTSAYEYFNTFSLRVCTMLNSAGYNFCKGNVMAMNKEWCQPISVWKKYFNKWINKGNAKDLLDINIFFDIRPVYGNFDIAIELKQQIFAETAKNPAYLYHLTQNTLLLKPQVGFWGNILIETAGAPPETVNIKEAIMPVVNFSRIYALKNNYSGTGTYDRLEFLYKNGVLPLTTYTNIIQALNYLNVSRLKHQTALLRNNLKPDNLISTNTLSELDKTIIKKVLSHINGMLSKLSYDFKGSA